MNSKSRLRRLFSPKSVAVVGGGVWCRSVIEQLFKIGYKGKIFPVHPSRKEISGLKSFKDLDDIPEKIDLIYIDSFHDAEHVKKIFYHLEIIYVQHQL